MNVKLFPGLYWTEEGQLMQKGLNVYVCKRWAKASFYVKKQIYVLRLRFPWYLWSLYRRGEDKRIFRMISWRKVYVK